MCLVYYFLHRSVSCCVFFFKQKTAYEMRISDWSSDVCSSDLPEMAQRLMYLFVELNKLGTAIVLATHDTHLLQRFRFPVMRLRDGQLVIERPAAEKGGAA